MKQRRFVGMGDANSGRHSVMPAGVLNQPGPETDPFRPTETVDLIMETISIYDMGAIWDVAKPNTQPSVCYTARAWWSIANWRFEAATAQPHVLQVELVQK